MDGDKTTGAETAAETLIAKLRRIGGTSTVPGVRAAARRHADGLRAALGRKRDERPRLKG